MIEKSWLFHIVFRCSSVLQRHLSSPGAAAMRIKGLLVGGGQPTPLKNDGVRQLG